MKFNLVILPLLTALTLLGTGCSQTENRALKVEFDKSGLLLNIGTIAKNSKREVKAKKNAQVTYQIEVKTLTNDKNFETEEVRKPITELQSQTLVNKKVTLKNGFLGFGKNKNLRAEDAQVDIAIETDHGILEFQNSVPVEILSQDEVLVKGPIKIPQEFIDLQNGATVVVRTEGRQNDGDIDAHIIGIKK
jgi:hypothetical protein